MPAREAPDISPEWADTSVSSRSEMSTELSNCEPVPKAQCWWLYLLLCRDGRTYAGIAIDVAARFAAHSIGKGAKFTRGNPPVSVLGTQAFDTKSEALKAEAALKQLNRTGRLAWAQKFPLTP